MAKSKTRKRRGFKLYSPPETITLIPPSTVASNLETSQEVIQAGFSIPSKTLIDLISDRSCEEDDWELKDNFIFVASEFMGEITAHELVDSIESLEIRTGKRYLLEAYIMWLLFNLGIEVKNLTG